jgi:hypothetical protein
MDITCHPLFPQPANLTVSFSHSLLPAVAGSMDIWAAL